MAGVFAYGKSSAVSPALVRAAAQIRRCGLPLLHDLKGAGFIASDQPSVAIPSLPGGGFAIASPSAVTPSAIASAYLSFGVGFPAELDGQFAAAIFEQGHPRLTLACDTFAWRGIWYLVKSGIVYFADTCEGLFACFGFSRVPCPRSIDCYFVLGQFLPPHTGFLGVHRLPLNSTLIAADGQCSVRTNLWTAPRSAPIHSAAEAESLVAEALSGELERLVQMPGRAGLLFSGGADSTAIAALMRSHKEITGFLATDISADGIRERGRALSRAHALNMPLRLVPCDTSAVHPAGFAAATGLPPFSFAEACVDCFARRIQAEAEVFVTGCGADTLFLSTEVGLELAASAHAGTRRPAIFGDALRSYKQSVRRLLYTPEFRARLAEYAPEAGLHRAFSAHAEDSPRIDATMQYLAMNHSRNIALYSHSFSRRAFAPFLTRRVIAASLAASAWEAAARASPKSVLHSIAQRFLPDALPAAKRGFAAVFSIEDWFTSPVLARSLDEIEASGILDAHLLHADNVRAIFRCCDHDRRSPQLLNTAWSILALAHWYAIVFNNQRTRADSVSAHSSTAPAVALATRAQNS